MEERSLLKILADLHRFRVSAGASEVRSSFTSKGFGNAGARLANLIIEVVFFIRHFKVLSRIGFS